MNVQSKYVERLMHRLSYLIKRSTPCLCIILLLMTGLSYSAEKKGQFIGSVETQYPDWFKTSFLDLSDDILEASEAGKRLMLIFYQDGCPYCNILIERNFSQKQIVSKTKNYFDVIALNIWGDREVTHVDGRIYTEKTFASAFNIQFTPTILFFDEKGKVVLRINGYHAPQRFNIELDYVAQHKEKEVSFRDFYLANQPETMLSKQLRKESFFKENGHNYSVARNRPFAIFFEQKDCPDCDYLHNEVLTDKKLLKIINQFDVSQLDMWSNTPLVTPEGLKITARDWAKKLKINFAPSLLIFNKEGKEIIRSEAIFKVFHTQGMFQYVLSEAYSHQPVFQRFLSEYSDFLMGQGIDVNIWNEADDYQ